MPDFLEFGKNTVFILACYGLSILCISTLSLYALASRTRATKLLAETRARTQKRPDVH